MPGDALLGSFALGVLVGAVIAVIVASVIWYYLLILESRGAAGGAT